MIKHLFVWYGIALTVFVLDQASKVWAEAALNDGPIIVVADYFQFQLAYNTGAAFSFLRDAGGWQRWFFTIVAFAVSVGIVVWIARIAKATPEKILEVTALSLVLGGAVGNLYDRATLGHVIDFIVWHYHDNYWPTFNIADAAICAGAALLVFDMLFVQGKKPQTA